MKRYLLPCSCSRRIAVTAAQAGGAVRCPGCGADVAVPRLGALGLLEAPVEEPAAAEARDWNAARALVLAGIIAATIAVAAAGWLRVRRSAVAPIDEPVIRTAVAAAPADQVHASWLEFKRQGIARPPGREEQRRQQHAQALAALEAVAWGAAVAGCLLAAAALIAERSPRRAGVASR